MYDRRIRFDYASFKSRDRAEMALEDMFATGDVCEAENPLIERRSTTRGTRYIITLPAE